jgi:hypothetical protein
MFWKEADQYMKTSQIMSPRLRNLIARRTPVRTPEWVDPPRASKSVHTQRKSHHVEPLPADYYAELECRTQATTANNVTAAAKAKEKTRGQPDPTLAAPAAEEEANNIALQPRKTITVSPRVLLVFRAILDHSQPHESSRITWQEFLQAMTYVGFDVDAVDGSECKFTPWADMHVKSIVIHMPHGTHSGGKLDRYMMRRIKRRLEHRYKWDMSTFVSE